MTHRDNELGKVFRELRREEHSSVPELSTVWARAVGASKRRRLHMMAATAATALVAASTMFFTLRPEPIETVPDASWIDWEAPTDFLLNFPGQELLTEIPRFGVPSSIEDATTRTRS